jgi:hypothetical protein
MPFERTAWGPLAPKSGVIGEMGRRALVRWPRRLIDVDLVDSGAHGVCAL